MQIKLDKIQQADLEKLRKWRMSGAVTKYMNTDPLITPEQQLDWYEKIKAQVDAYYWLIKCDEVAIGFFSITNIDHHRGSCEIGHYIGEEKYRNKGIGKIIEANICRYIFEVLKLKIIIFDIFEENVVAYKLHQAFGAVEDETKRRKIIKNGCQYTTIRMCIHYKVWEKEIKDKVYPLIEIHAYTV